MVNARIMRIRNKKTGIVIEKDKGKKKKSKWDEEEYIRGD